METRNTGGQPHESTASGAKQEAAHETRRVADEARRRSQDMLTQQQRRACEGVAQFAEALRHSADELAEKDQQGVARFTRQTADSLSQFADAMREADMTSMMHRTTQFAREQPALFLGGALALGFAGSRFLKSTEHPEQSAVRGSVMGGQQSESYADRSRTTPPNEHVDATSGHHRGPAESATAPGATPPREGL